ncbi:biotin synthase auxiliary protein BsaP [Paenarthrobacter sp. RAF54_2]|uniref:biotin synthase auxiliary protein BsaP n=1 Tax=Paenarthrobacter sp. RAF54_2 TaxID=3233061 RepID=UPI003F99B499
MTAVDAVTAQYCGHCGGSVAGGTKGERPTSDPHQGCHQRLAMEPPRYCAQCRRRMKVQVTPLGWSAECSRHGRVSR